MTLGLQPSVTKIVYLGHAGFIFEHDGTSILMDPWFYAGNLGSIFPYPDNAFVRDDVLRRRFDYLYISHAHTDHYDRRFLEQLDKDVTVLCPAFRSRELEWLLEDMGFNIMAKLEHQESTRLTETLSVTMLINSSAVEDSGLLIEADGFRFLDLNDCQINSAELPEADILACQFSGAIHFPQTYDMYDQATKNEKASSAVETYVDLFRRKVAAIQPRYFIPSAGPFCFLHPQLLKYNPSAGTPTVFVDWENFSGRVSDSVAAGAALRIFPSDVVHIDVMSKTCTVEENYSKLNPYPDDTIEAYASRRAEETAPYCAKVAPRVSTEELAAHWRDIERHNKRLLAFRSFSKNFIIEAYEQSGEFLRRWYLHIGADGVSVDDNPPAGFVSAYTFKIPMLMLRKVVDGETNWDEMVASHHMLLSRDPDIFDPQFFALLRYHHAPARGRLFVLAGDSNEMIALAGDPTTRIQRFCPHAGEDLTGVEACNGVFVCPRHRWEWDLRTGECIKGGNIPLRVEHGPTVPDHKFAAV